MNTKHVLLGLVLAFGVPSFGCGSDAKKDKDESAESDKSDKKDKKKDEKEKDKGEKASGSATAAATAAPGGGTTAPAAVAGSAFSHLPGDCQVAVTMDLGKTLAHPAFQKEVAPLLEEIVSAPSPKDEDFKKFQAFVQKTGTSPKSVKTVGICVKGISAGNEGDWGFVLGGDFKPDSIVAAREEHKDAKDKVIDVDGRKALTSDKATVGQFGDASIGLAKTLDIFKSLAGTNESTTDHVYDPLVVNDVDVRGSRVYKCVKGSTACHCRACTGDEKAPLDGTIYLQGLAVWSVVLTPAANGPVPTPKSAPKTLAKNALKSFLPVSKYVSYALEPGTSFVLAAGGTAMASASSKGFNVTDEIVDVVSKLVA